MIKDVEGNEWIPGDQDAAAAALLKKLPTRLDLSRAEMPGEGVVHSLVDTLSGRYMPMPQVSVFDNLDEWIAVCLMVADGDLWFPYQEDGVIFDRKSINDGLLKREKE